MYVYLRFLKIAFTRKDPDFHPLDETVLHLRVRLSDRDIYPELNNGRYYAMMDLGRTHLGQKLGFLQVLKKNKWALVAAGSTGQWRRRILWRQRYELRTRLIHFDERWYYFYQRFMRGDVMHASFLLRVGVASKSGLIPPEQVNTALGHPGIITEPTEWLQSWIASEKLRPT